MKYATTILLACTIVIGELHTVWERQPVRYENWIINRNVPMSVQQNVKNACDQLNFILYFVAFLSYAGHCNRVNKTTVKTFAVFMFADAALYFWNYKTYDYYIVYFWLIGIWALIYLIKWKK